MSEITIKELVTKTQLRKGFVQILSLFSQLTQAVSDDLDAMQDQIDEMGDAGPVAFSVNEQGHLILHYTGDDAPNYSINSDGHLILTL